MRLTLRTLLAYMDDILDPADQDDLARQVEESEKASELIHRTRDAMRRLRLGAPPVIGEGMELDPNCVAEYLDNTMSPDDMTEFQQVCLDSDVHLAEVASCHHILTMVLGEPAEIDSAMRQRMYGVPGRVDEWRQLRLDGAHRVASDASSAAPEPRKSDSAVDEPITEVPDYLKAGDSAAFGRMALAFAAALVLGFGAFMLFGPGGILRDKQQNVGRNEPQTTAPEVDQGGVTPQDLGDQALLSAEEGTASEATAESSMAEGSTAGDTEGQAATDNGSAVVAGQVAPEATGGIGLPPLAGSESGIDVDTAAEPPVAEALDRVVDENMGVAGSLDGTEGVVDTDIASPPLAGPMGDEVDEHRDGTPPLPDERLAMNTTERTETMPDTLADSEAATGLEATEPVPLPEAAPLGTMVAVDQVLLRWDSLNEQWLRMPARASIAAGDQLLSLPTYRPSLALVSGLRVEFCDGAIMMVDYADDRTTPRLGVTYGHFLLQNTDMEPMEVEIAVGNETKRVVLESTAVLGFDVDRPFVAGADVESKVGTFAATFYAPEGKVIWNVGENPLPVVTASQWSWDDVTVDSIADDIGWLNGQSLDYLMQNVSRSFEREFDTDRPARLQLLELYETSRRREERSLAAQCGTHVGQFVPLVQALADTRQQSNWDEHIDELRRAMSRSTQAARLVHETLVEQRGAGVADDLFAMLQGYSRQAIGMTREQVQTGVTRQLIDWLQHDRLEYRVLAIQNLKQIYGGKTLGYNPVVTEPRRQELAVKQWRTRLADNELVPTYLE